MTQPTHGLDPNALEAALTDRERIAAMAAAYPDAVADLTWAEIDEVLAALSQNPGTSNTSGEALRAHLREHWLASIVCDHEAKTDTAVCSCSQWADTPHPSVGAAVDAWIEHVFETLPAALEPRASDREAVAVEALKQYQAAIASCLTAGGVPINDLGQPQSWWTEIIEAQQSGSAAIRKLSEVSHV